MRRLSNGAAVDRLFAPRLSIATRFHDCDDSTGPLAPTRCATGSRAPAGIEALAEKAAATIHEAPSVDVIHAAALIDLQWGHENPVTLQRVITQLSAAALASPTPSGILSDLAAAHLIRAETEHDALEIMSALDAAQRAIRSDPANRQARFNLALSAERLGLSGRAEREWARVADEDSGSAWAGEARQHMARIRAGRFAAPVGAITVTAAARLVQSDAGAARTRGVQELGAWGRAIVGGRSEGDASLDAARMIAAALAESRLDASLSDAIVLIDRASAAERRRLAAAHDYYARANASFEDSRFAVAAALYDSTVKAATTGAVITRWALVNRGAALVLSDSVNAGLKMLETSALAVDSMRFPALAGRVQWCLATTLLRGERPALGVRAAEAAIRHLGRAREIENLGAVQTLRSEVDFRNGRSQEAGVTMIAASRNLGRYAASRWRHNLLFGMARLAASTGVMDAAGVIREEDLDVAVRMDNPIYSTELILERALARAQAGDRPGADHDFALADSGIGRMSQPGAKRWFSSVADIHRSMAGYRREAGALDSAVSFFGPQGRPGADALPRSSPHYLAALLARADERRSTDDAGSRKDLDRALGVIDAMARGSRTSAERAALLRVARPTISRAALAQLAAGDNRRALAVVERGRLRFASNPPSSLAAAPGTVVVDALLVGDTLVTWTIRGTMVRSHRATVNARELEGAADRARAGLELGVDVRAELELLHARLIAPISAELADSASLVFVADGALASIPFDALRSRGSRRYLIEDHTIMVTGALSDTRAIPHVSGHGEALLVGDPAFDRQRHPGLERLRGARAEVSGIARLYPGATVLREGEAMRSAVMAAMRNASVVHLAAHAQFDPASPGRSRVILAAAEGGTDDLTADDISSMKLLRAPIVVLAACESVRGASSSVSASLPGLAEALLDAGASGVVGTLWRVDDTLTVSVMQAFHEELKRVNNGAKALRAAQLAMLHSGNAALRAPGTWAAFRYAGR